MRTTPNGLLVPATTETTDVLVPPVPEGVDGHDVDIPQDVPTLDAVAELESRLRTDRRSEAVRASHEVAVRRGKLLRRRELMLLRDDEAELAADLRTRERDRKARVALEDLRRATASGGHRARVKALILRSAEHRALRVERVRRWGMRVGVGALLVMAAWSTAGVHAGVVRLLDVGAGEAGWYAAWLMEPALMTVVATVILARSTLGSSGGALNGWADWVEYGALGASVALNLAGGGAAEVHGWAPLLGMYAAHSIGPVGAAAIAFLLGLIDRSCSEADPWGSAPSMADLGLIEATEPQSTSQDTIHMASERPKQMVTPINQPKLPASAVPELSPADHMVLEATRAAITRGELTTPVTATSIYRDVMGRRGDKGRASRVASIVTATAA